MKVKTVKQAVAKAISEHDFKRVEWIAAGGSYGGFYPADFAMTHEAAVLCRMHTSNEFVFAPPATRRSTICLCLLDERTRKPVKPHALQRSQCLCNCSLC